MTDTDLTFSFDFDPRYARLLKVVFGATPENSHVLLTDQRFSARFGRFRCSTSLDNVKDVQITRDYTAIKAIGARGSMKDRGASFGSNTVGGVCLCFHEPVKALAPARIHPGLTVTVGDLEGLAAAVRERAGL